jgi:hypothetical protein
LLDYRGGEAATVQRLRRGAAGGSSERFDSGVGTGQETFSNPPRAPSAGVWISSVAIVGSIFRARFGAVMNYKGIEYRVLQTTTLEDWAWSFDPPKSVSRQGPVMKEAAN